MLSSLHTNWTKLPFFSAANSKYGIVQLFLPVQTGHDKVKTLLFVCLEDSQPYPYEKLIGLKPRYILFILSLLADWTKLVSFATTNGMQRFSALVHLSAWISSMQLLLVRGLSNSMHFILFVCVICEWRNRIWKWATMGHDKGVTALSFVDVCLV